jgi:LPS O-antigen subunit length determinant protein (WzzB/FepE family)
MTAVDEVAELREATRQAHEALKDLRLAVKEAVKLKDSIEQAAQVAMDERIAPAVEKGLEEFRESLKKAIDTGTEAVFHRFDTVADTLLGEDRATRRQGKPSIPEMFAARKVLDQ